jgi:ABC-type bacteriocin/lantibiotic exporter with double-glycine peptidase domain
MKDNPIKDNLEKEEQKFIHKLSNEKVYKNIWYLIFFLFKNNYIIIINFLIMVFRGFIATRIPKTIAQLTEVVSQYKPWYIIQKVFIWSFIITFLSILIRIMSIYFDNKASIIIDNNLSRIIHTYLINQDAYYRNSISTINFSLNANNLLRLSKIWSKFNRIIYLFIELIFCLWTLFWDGNNTTNYIILIFFILYGVFFYYAIPKNQEVTDNSIKSWNRVCRYINNTFNYLNTIHIFHTNTKRIQEFSSLSEENQQKRDKMFFMKNIILSFVDLSFTIYQYVVLFFVIRGIYMRKLTPGFLTLFSILIYRTYHNLKEIISEYKIIEDISVAMEAMKNIFFQDIISTETYDINKNILSPKNYDINIKNLTFKGHNNQDNEYILNIKSLQFKSLEKYVIMGSSGCGKTSLVNALIGLWNYKGKIFLGEDLLNEYNLQDIRQYIHLISQETTILPINILENIRYSNPEASLEEVKYAAKKCCIHDFIETLPNGYYTSLNEDMNLSGGQKQKIMLARLFVSSAPIIILDETTSSLDIKTENIVYKNINKYLKDKTIIIIAHRIGVLNHFDNIILMEKGKVLLNDKLSILKENPIFQDFLNKFPQE